MKNFLLACLCAFAAILPASAADVYKLVKSVDELGDEATCIIVSQGSNVAMSTTQNNNNRGSVSVEINDDKIVASDQVAVVTIVKSDSKYSLYADNGTSTGYLGSATSGKNNYLKTYTSPCWATISIDESTGNATVKFSNNNTGDRNILRYNSSNNIFACYSSGQNDVQLFVLSNDDAPVYPTECAAPVFSFNGVGVLPQVSEVEGYAGNRVSVACPTRDSEIIWSVSKNNGVKSDISELEYTIPAEAGEGDVFTFTAQAVVEGENDLIMSEEVTLSVKVLAIPLEGYFYTPSVTDAPVWGCKLVNASGTAGGSNNTKTTALCAVEGGFNSGVVNLTFSDSDGSSYAYINKDNTLSIYKQNVFTISVSEKYVITAIEFDKANDSLEADGGVFADGKWTPADEEAVNAVKFTYTDTESNWTSGCISTIKVTVEAVPEPVIPDIPELDGFTLDETGSIMSDEKVIVNFKKVEGIDIYYKVNNKVQSVAVKAECAADHGDFSKHAGESIELTNAHSSLQYFACDPVTGAHSSVRTVALNVQTGVAEIEVTYDDEAEYYNLQGARVANPAAGLYIRVCKGKAEKVILK